MKKAKNTQKFEINFCVFFYILLLTKETISYILNIVSEETIKEVTMKKEYDILNNFKIIFDKQAVLSKHTNYELFEEFSVSEVHTIDLIGNEKDINGVMIAEKLEMTRGAISKIISKLKDKKLIDSYQNEDNKKEIYYRLTEAGKDVYEQHKKAHSDWEDRELLFLDKIEDEKKEIIREFLEEYNEYLSKLIKERGRKK